MHDLPLAIEMCPVHPAKAPVDASPSPTTCPKKKKKPPNLGYAMVVKERAKGQVVHVTTRLIYGTTEQVETALRMSPVSRTVKTYCVERQNLTVHQHSRRMGA